MARSKKSEEPVYVDASLIIPKKKFAAMLQAQIKSGENLLEIDVPVINQPSYRGGYYPDVRNCDVDYDEKSKKSFIAKFDKWHNYNIELYKTSFSAPNNTYRHDYESKIWYNMFGCANIIKEYKDNIERLINQMKSDINKINLIPCELPDAGEKDQSASSIDKKKVFIVHGHDDAVINEVKLLLLELDLIPIVLREQPNEGLTIIEKIEKNTDVGYAIVLYTPCDEGKAKEDESYQSRARQNVVFEHGFLCAKLGRKNVCVLVKGDVEMPGDLKGIVYTSKSEDWKLQVGKELKSANVDFDASKLL